MDILGLAAMAALGWFWYDGLRSREAALAEAKTVCAGEGLQLLDETVALQRLSLRRDASGMLRVHRVFGFEYSTTGDSREAGSVVVLGGRVVLVSLSTAAIAGVIRPLH